MDLAKSRGMSTKEVLQFDHVEGNLLFDGDMPSKPRKSELVTEKNIFVNLISPLELNVI